MLLDDAEPGLVDELEQARSGRGRGGRARIEAALAVGLVEQIGEIEVYEYGKFGWIMDPEGNKIELWEPVDEKL